jgi:uncharacterized protein
MNNDPEYIKRVRTIKKIFLVIVGLLLIYCISFVIIKKLYYKAPLNTNKKQLQETIKKIQFNSDKNNNGIDDLDDILIGARQEVKNKTKYKNAYYVGGYPPADEGVCTDVVSRALKNAGYDLKTYIDNDIKNNLSNYSASVKTPDPNIDFRRVKNQYVFLKRFATNLTTDVIPNDKSNLALWQGGDIVVLDRAEHIAIVSDKRRIDGVPLIIHNNYLYAKEEDYLMVWAKNKRIIGHFRFPKIR